MLMGTSLANFIIARRKGGDINNDKAAEQEMRRLAMKYSHLDLAVATDTSDEYEAKASHPVLVSLCIEYRSSCTLTVVASYGCYREPRRPHTSSSSGRPVNASRRC